jgi:putative PIN family toxin of toxin-antitoxin system
VRAVLDLNVFASALINPAGVPARVVRLGLQQRFGIVVCPVLLDELDAVLHRPALRRYFSEAEAEEFVGAVAGAADVEPDPTVVAPVSRDPDDDYLVALAAASGAGVLVTGDADLLEVETPDVRIVPPAAFLDELERQ